MFLYILALICAFGLGASFAYFIVRKIANVTSKSSTGSGVADLEKVTAKKTAEVELPKDLFPSLVSSGAGTNEDSITGINLLLQFLFREKRFSKQLHQAIIQRINDDIEEQLSSSRAGKLVHKINIHDFDLGNTIPLLKKMEVVKSEIEPIRKTVEMVELLVGVQYSGAFHLSLDVETAIVPDCRLSLSLSGLSGEGQLCFSRKPYSHWAFSFVKPPDVDMEVKSTIQGKTFTQVTTLVAALASKILQRKHVLPNYRIRYKPFFHAPEGQLNEYPKVAPPVPVGSLSVTVKESSRLLESTLEDGLHCTLAVGMNAFVSAGRSQSSDTYVMTLKVARRKNQPLGIIFKPADAGENVEVEDAPSIIAAVTPGSPAHAAGIMATDVVTHVDGIATPAVRDAAAAVIGAGERFMITIERKGKLDLFVSDLEKYVDVQMPTIQLGDESKSEEMPPVAEPVDMLPFQNEQPTVEYSVSSPGVAEVEKVSNVQGSTGTTPEPTNPLLFEVAAEATPFKRFSKDLTIKRTTTVLASPDPTFNETVRLEIRPGDLYFNLAIWTVKKSELENEKLVGHISVPLADITSECESTGLSHYVTAFQVCPPDCEGKDARDHPLSSHVGFEPRLCYGDILLSFVYNAVDEQAVQGAFVQTDETRGVSTEEFAHNLVQGSEQILREAQPKAKIHTFILTHFHGSIYCDYCAGRIWLRDAVQCITCGIVCHRKCKERCVDTVCQPMRRRHAGHLPRKDELREDLKIPFSVEDVENLIEDNPFLPTEDEEGDELNAAVHRLLASESNEKMTRLAKNTAPELYDHLPIQERKQKICSMISNLQKAIKSEEDQSGMLAGQSQIDGVSVDMRKRLAMQMSRCEEKKKALALLLLHYSSALQYLSDLENAMKLEAQKTMNATVTSDLVA